MEMITILQVMNNKMDVQIVLVHVNIEPDQTGAQNG